MTRTVEQAMAKQAPPRVYAPRAGFLFAIVVLALVFAHRQALADMVQLWNVSPMYSYGFAVPFISACLLWTRRAALADLVPHPRWLAGGAVLVCGLAMAVAGRAAGIQVLEQVAFLVSLTGAVLVLFGGSYVRIGWPALAYLLLMVPLWDGLTEPLHAPFQQRSAEMGVWVLQTLGIPAYREGLVITLPALTIEVGRACSGVNYLVAVLALGLPLSYVYLRQTWRRVILLTSAVVVAALSNGLRVALIALLAHFEVGSPLHGPFHVLHGLFVAGIGYLVLFAGLRILARGGQADARAEVTAATSPQAGSDVPLRLSMGAASVLVVLFLITGSDVLARTSHDVPLNGALDSFPSRLGDWMGERIAAWEPRTDSSLWAGADAEFRRRYRRADGAVVDLYIGYFASQRQDKEIVNHKAEELHARAADLRVTTKRGGFDANLVDGGREGRQTLFWYSVDGTPEGDRYAVKARTLWCALRRGETNGAVVVLTSRAGERGSRIGVLQELGSFVEEALAARLPGRSRSAGK